MKVLINSVWLFLFLIILKIITGLCKWSHFISLLRMPSVYENFFSFQNISVLSVSIISLLWPAVFSYHFVVWYHLSFKAMNTVFLILLSLSYSLCPNLTWVLPNSHFYPSLSSLFFDHYNQFFVCVLKFHINDFFQSSTSELAISN